MDETPPEGAADDAYQRVSAFLRTRGVSDEEIDQARDDRMLHLLVADCVVMPEPIRYTTDQMVELSGLDADLLTRLWRAMGFPDVGPGERAFTDADLEAVLTAHAFLHLGMADMDEVVQLTRVVGSSMARIAEAEVVASPLFRVEGDGLDAADFLVTSTAGSLPAVARLLEYVWRRHLLASLRRAAMLQSADLDLDGTGDRNVQALAVGFADLVGFTAQSAQLSETELNQLVGRFEGLAHDTVVRRGGRVVKMIGDEVMFVVDDPVAAIEVALSLADAYADDDVLSDVRVGLAHGPVLVRDGDCYGPTVNLAHRIVNVARPGSVVVDARLKEAVSGDDDGTDDEGEVVYWWRSLRPRYLKDIGRVPLFVPRRRDDENERLLDTALRMGQGRFGRLLAERPRERAEDRHEDEQ